MKASASSKSVEVIPERLAWAAEGRDRREGWKVFSFQHITAPEFRGGNYGVPHYPPQSLGEAKGPLALDQTLCFALHLAAAAKGPQPVLVEYGLNNPQRANAAVLLGVYLILTAGWTAGDLAKKLSAEANLKFPCSWAKRGTSQHLDPNMSVRDCWAGFALAKQRGWMALPSIEDPVLVALAVSQYRRMAQEFDASWLALGQVIVMADPMSTVRDPNPVTCGKLILEEGGSASPGAASLVNIYELDDGEQEPGTPFSRASSRSEGPMGLEGIVMCERRGPEDDKDDSDLLKQQSRETTQFTSTCVPTAEGTNSMQLPDADAESNESLITVCKDYVAPAGEVAKMASSGVPFITFLQRCLVKTVVRTNSSDEAGLGELGGSYDSDDIKHNGMDHYDFFVKDVRGGLPDRATIVGFLKAMCDAGMDQGSKSDGSSGRPVLAIHCKGGFGRSMLLACVLLVFLHDVPGRAVLAWSRIVRPGAFNTTAQESFLCNLRGRADVEGYLPGGEGKSQKKCCTVQ